MKKYILCLIVMLASLSAAVGQQNPVTKLEGLDFVMLNFEYSNDSVLLSMVVDLSELKLKSSKSLALTPTLFGADNQKKELETIVVRGRNNAKLYKRTMDLNNRNGRDMYNEFYKDTYTVVDFFGKERKALQNNGDTLVYRTTVPYESWMVDSKVGVSCAVYSCCYSRDAGCAVPMVNNALCVELLSVSAYEVLPVVSLIKPERVAVKRRDVTYSAALVFKVNSSVIDPTLQSNSAELRSIDQMMQSVISDQDYTITAVNITGFASPEGTLKSNQLLSERRAKALETIMKRDYNLAPKLYNVAFGGENWDALVPMVLNSDMDDKQEILDIIKYVDINDGREAKLMKLNGGVPYKYMLKNFFAAVRQVVVDVEYNVDAYDLVRIKEVIEEKPQNLSLEEFHRLSQTYEISSDEFLKVFQAAVRVYPNDEVALNNAIAAQIRKGTVEGLSEMVGRVNHSTASVDMLNTLGAYYMLSEEYAKAEELLILAASMGSADAQLNLKQLKTKLENIADIAKSEELLTKIYGK